METKELVKLFYDEKEYLIYLDNNIIRFGRKKDNIIDTNLSIDEIAELKYILPHVIISNDKNNYVDLGFIKYKDKDINVYLDKVSKLRFFYELKENTYTLPDENTLEELNHMFNNTIISETRIVLENHNKRKYNKHYAKKYIKIRNKLIVAFILSASLAISANVMTELVDSGYSTRRTFSYESIVSFIENNPYLSDKEKRTLLVSKEIFKENQEYVDMNFLEDCFTKLRIEYAKDKHNDLGISKIVSGVTYKESNRIVLLNSNSIEDCDKDTLYHEFCHVFNYKYGKTGYSLLEAINETMQNEYYYGYYINYGIAYATECEILHALCEIVDPEIFKKIHFSGEIDLLVNELVRIGGNENDAIRLINSIDTLNILNTNINHLNMVDHSAYIKEYPTYVENSKINNNAIYGLIKKYFELKYGYHMEEDPVMMLYLRNIMELNTRNYFRVDYKGIFSEKYKQLFREDMCIELIKNGDNFNSSNRIVVLPNEKRQINRSI